MFSFGRKKEKETVVEKAYTTPDSPKVTRERKSKDIDVTARSSPRQARRGGALYRTHSIDHSNEDWQLRYTIEKEDYAKGAYGKIMLATDKSTTQKVVIKKIPQSTPIRMVNNEVRAGKFVGAHPNIAQLYQYIDRPDFHYLVFQYVKGEDLFCYLEKLSFTPQPEIKARSIVRQIVQALKHIHSHSIAHRDIKLENILIDENGHVHVIDFGLCAFIQEGAPCREWCGSDNYLAPEIVRRTPYNGYKVDVFSTGVVLFALIFGVFPFENLRVHGAQTGLKKLVARFPSDVKASSAVKDLLSKMLEDDAEKRASLDDILNHEWLKEDASMDSPKTNLKLSCESVI